MSFYYEVESFTFTGGGHQVGLCTGFRRFWTTLRVVGVVTGFWLGLLALFVIVSVGRFC